MSTFSSSQPSIRARVLPRFPAQVLAGDGMIITKSGGTYVFAATGIVTGLNKLPAINSDRILGRDSAGLGPPEELTVSAGIGFTAAGGIQLQPNQRLRLINSIWTTGTATDRDYVVPFSCTITSVTLLADTVGIAVVDIRKSTFASYPTVTSICGSSLPTMNTAIKSQDNVLSGWNTSLTAGDILRFAIISVATIGRLSINLTVVTV